MFAWLVPTTQAQSGTISGQVLDQTANQPLAFASVSLYRLGDSTQVGGTLADSSGYFSMQKVKAGQYYLRIRFLGYEPFFVKDLILTNREQRSLGALTLVPSPQLLEEIDIVGRKRRSLQQVDRQVFEAGQFQAAQGGNVTDIIRNLPGIAVNIEGEITLRGSSGFLIMVDGRQLQTTPAAIINQLPANAIESIEVITTPSAKYDPDGAAGIINIKTKQGATGGYYLQVNGLIGAPSIEPYGNAEASSRFGGDVVFNLRSGKWEFSIGADYRRNDLAGQRIGYVNTLLDGVLTEYPSNGERSFDRIQYGGRFTAQYRPKPGHEVGFSLFAGDRTQDRTADILYQPQQRLKLSTTQTFTTTDFWERYQSTGKIFNQGELIDSLTYFNENLRVRQGDFLIGGIDYQWNIGQEKRLAVSALYERTILGGPTDNASLAWPNVADSLQYQFNTNDNPLDGIRLKVDFTSKLKTFDWESGYQFRFLNHPGDFVYLDRDFENNRFISNPLFTNRIELRRQIHSLYTNLSGEWGKAAVSAGVRLEYMNRQVGLAEPDTTYLYDILQPFPSLTLAYPLTESLSLRLGYSRRIERTTTFKMTPFPEREHNETLEQGDATLLPEFIDQVELSLAQNWGDNSIFLTPYFRRTQNVINRVNTVFNDSILNRIYTNAGNATALGLELGTNLYPTPWFQIYVGGNIYRYEIQGDLFGDDIQTANTIYSLNGNLEFDLGSDIRAQAGLNFLSERVTAQGRDSRFYNPYLTLRKTFAQGRWSAALQWQSIDLGLLESNEQRITTSRPTFFTTTNYVYEVDRIILTLSFQLNQVAKPLKFIKSEFGEKEY